MRRKVSIVRRSLAECSWASESLSSDRRRWAREISAKSANYLDINKISLQSLARVHLTMPADYGYVCPVCEPFLNRTIFRVGRLPGSGDRYIFSIFGSGSQSEVSE